MKNENGKAPTSGTAKAIKTPKPATVSKPAAEKPPSVSTDEKPIEDKAKVVTQIKEGVTKPSTPFMNSPGVAGPAKDKISFGMADDNLISASTAVAKKPGKQSLNTCQ